MTLTRRSLCSPIVSEHSSDNPQLSTPPESPQPRYASSEEASEDLRLDFDDGTGLTENLANFSLYPPEDIELPTSPPLDPLREQLAQPLFELQLGSTEFQFAQEHLDLYDTLLNAHTTHSEQLNYDDRLYLLELQNLSYPTAPPTPVHAPVYYTPYMAQPAGTGTGAGAAAAVAPPAAAITPTVAARTITELIGIRPGDYRFPQLKGRENYAAWKVHMRGLFRDAKLWPIIQGQLLPVLGDTNLTEGDGTTVPCAAITQVTIDEWTTRRDYAVGEMQRRCDIGPLAHINEVENPHIAWRQLQTMYENVGTAAMTVLHQQFYQRRMKEAGSVEEHIREMRKYQEQINLAINEQGGDKIQELQFIRQVVSSLPESWEIFISVLDFDFNTTNDPGGLNMSKRIQNRLLAEDLRRKAKTGDSALFVAPNRSSQSNNRPFNPNNRRAVDASRLTCNNCQKLGHIARNCRKPGGGAWKRKGRAYTTQETDEFAFTFVEISADNAETREHAYSIEPTHSFILDSAATCHIGNKSDQFKSLRPYSGQVKGMGGLAQIEGIGEIDLHVAKDSPKESHGSYRITTTSHIRLKDAYFIPSSPVNLISLSKLTDQRPEIEIIAKHDKITFYDPDKDDTIATAIKSGTRSSGNPWILFAIIDSEEFSYVARSLSDWHLILGHVNTRTILNMVNQKLVKGIEITKQSTRKPNIDCIGCVKGKSIVRPFKKADNAEFPVEVGQVIYSDTWGPARTVSIQGNEYMITFTDGATRYTLIYFMKHKNEAFENYKKAEAWLNTQFGKSIKRFHYDGGRELVHSDFRDYCAKKGTVVTTTAPYSSSSNGYVEVLNRRYAEKARSLMQASPHTKNMPFLWQEAMTYANNIKNRTPTHIGDKYISPYQALFGRIPDLSHYQLWGSLVQVLIQGDKNKIGTRTKSAILTGIEDSPSGMWRYLAMPHRSIQVTRNMYFQKVLPNPANSDEGEPMGHSKESQIDELDDFIEIAPPIEGEIVKKEEKKENSIENNKKSTHTLKENSTHSARSTLSTIKQTEESEQKHQSQQSKLTDTSQSTKSTKSPEISGEGTFLRSAQRSPEKGLSLENLPGFLTQSMQTDYDASRAASLPTRRSEPTVAAETAPTEPTGTSGPDSRTGPVNPGVANLRSAYNSGAARLRRNRDNRYQPVPLDGPSTRTRSRRQAQGLDQPEDFRKITKDHGGTRSEAFWVIPNKELDNFFTSHGYAPFTQPSGDEDDTNCDTAIEKHRVTPIESIPFDVRGELDTFYWCEDIPQTVAWMTNMPNNLTAFKYSNEVDDLGDHPTLSQLMRHPLLWPMAEEAMEAEIAAFQSKEVYELKELPPYISSSSVIPCHWRFTIRRDKDGQVIRIKARLVAGGDHQIPGRDFTEIFASTISTDTIRLLLAIGCKYDLDIIHMDVDAAFLNAPLDDIIFIRQPPHFSDSTSRVWHLKKSMYGLRQAPRDWERHRTHLLEGIGFNRLMSETSVYTRREDHNIAIIASYVDDFLILTTRGYADKVRDDIMGILKSKDLGPISSFLGIQVDRDRKDKTLKLSMPNYIKKVLPMMGMDGCAGANTPASHTTVLTPRAPDQVAPDYPYLSAIGRLLWLALTVRPDISFIVGALARHTQTYTNAHITAIKRVLRYLSSSSEVGLHYKAYDNDDIEIAYADASYGNKEEGPRTLDAPVPLGTWTSDRDPNSDPHR
ncbi:Copia protein [Ceratobasidium theobromae]|uniref:Copia protein n=1 Tax=Ceratobasidium theobromae TaxID=1582974 RepID=A0A5N5Q8P6_9AGAM|nr:Copia protein [Ceratobasidium theobromae]